MLCRQRPCIEVKITCQVKGQVFGSGVTAHWSAVKVRGQGLWVCGSGCGLVPEVNGKGGGRCKASSLGTMVTVRGQVSDWGLRVGGWGQQSLISVRGQGSASEVLTSGVGIRGHGSQVRIKAQGLGSGVRCHGLGLGGYAFG